MTTDAEDRSTWPRNRQVIRRDELLRLIEENGGPKDLDLRGAVFVGDGLSGRPESNPMELSPAALEPGDRRYRQEHADRQPAWVARLGTQGGMNLSRAWLERAVLGPVRLQRADLTEARLQGADLCRAQLEEADLYGAQLHGADLLGAQLQRADLRIAQLQRGVLVAAQLRGANLGGAELREAILIDADLHGADVTSAHLQNANLRGTYLDRVDMYDVDSLDGAHWYRAHLDHTRIKRESLGKAIGEELKAHKNRTPEDYHGAKEAYLLLKNNFNQIGRYEDASWAYVKEQQMEKMALHWEWRSHGWQVWRAWGFLWRWLRNWAYELLTGYGERPWNAVRAGLVGVLAFAVGFWASGIAAGRGALAFLDCVVYSVATFATSNLARSDLNPTGRGVEIASSLEAILGISVLALVVFTVGNRMSRS